MKVYCPYCGKEITSETTKCSSCGTVYGDDTLEFVRGIFEKGNQQYKNERRRQIRVQKTFKAAYSTPKDFARRYIYGLSLGGVFVETNDPLEPGEKLDLKIFLLDKTESIEIPCEVMWSRKQEELTPEGKVLPPGMGVKFLDLSKSAIERILDVLSKA